MSAAVALNRVAKWRTLLAGWQLGTRAKGDPESDAVRDHRELSILLRVEVTALVDLLIRKGVISSAEFQAAIEREANLLSKDFERRFPGVRATDSGLTMDVAAIRRAGWQEGWKP